MIKQIGYTRRFSVFIAWYDSRVTGRQDNHFIPFMFTFCPSSQIMTLETKQQEQERLKRVTEEKIHGMLQVQAPKWEII